MFLFHCVPCKQNHERENHLPFLKRLSKEIMTRTRVRNTFFKKRTEENKTRYAKQRNYCVSLLRKTKSKYYSNLDEKDVTDNKMFWKTVKPFLPEKVTSFSEKNTLIEKDKIIENDSDTLRVLNTFFSNILSNLIIPEYTKCDPLSEFISDPFLKTLIKYSNHSTTLKIEEVCHGSNAINF